MKPDWLLRTLLFTLLGLAFVAGCALAMLQSRG
jgi:hypothetical protein